MLTKCPECGHDVSTKAEICPNCGSPIKKEEGQKLENRTFYENSQQRRSNPILAVLIVVILMSIVAIFVAKLNNKTLPTQQNSGKSSVSTSPVAVTPIAPSINIGDHVTINEGGTIFAKTIFNWETFSKAMYVEDTIGEIQMKNNGDIFLVKNEDKALVLDTYEYFDNYFNQIVKLVQLRLLSGGDTGEAGWTYESACKKP